MEKFLSEVLDLDTSDLSIAATLVVDGLLQYDLIFNNATIQSNLAFCWIWKESLGTYPSKVDVMIFAKQQQQQQQHQQINDIYKQAFDYIASHTFYKFIPNELQKIKDECNGRFISYTSTLTTNKAFTKQELFYKLQDRLNPTWCTNNTYNYDVTLYQSFLSLMQKDPYHSASFSAYINDINNKQMYANPITKCLVHIPIELPRIISRYDILKLIYSRDYYFNRIMCQGVTVVSCNTQESAYECLSSCPNIQLAIGLNDIIFKICATAYVCDRDDIDDMKNTVPKFAAKCIIFGPSDVVLSRKPTDTIVFAKNDNNNDMYDLQVSSQITAFIGGQSHIPVAILQKLIELYTIIKRQRQRQTKDQINDQVKQNRNTNCVLLVDNRKSLTSVMSTTISMHNLQKSEWDLVILTSEATRSFYENHFSNAMFITHPLIGAKFNIETYNRIMKDEKIWEQLDECGYTKCLIVQDDGLLIRPGVENEFLEYDYVGAPWLTMPHLVTAGIGPEMVGNGGISLRTVKIMLEICRKFHDEKMHLFNYDIQPVPEDVYFASLVEKKEIGGRIPTSAKAKRFAMEQIVNMEAFGMHKPWPYVGEQVVLEYIQNAINDCIHKATS